MTDDDLRRRLVERVLMLPAARLDMLKCILDALESNAEAPRPKSIQDSQVRRSSAHANKDWPHAPIHRLNPNGTYLVTAGTHARQHFFHSAERLDCLHDLLLELAREYNWQLEAWAVFSNHYHLVGHALNSATNLPTFLSVLHTKTATFVNELDEDPGRQVWHNYWETELTFEQSYLARLNYVHQNAVKHGLVAVANQYRWCSAAWFERTATRAQVNTIYRFKTDKLRILDDFGVRRVV